MKFDDLDLEKQTIYYHNHGGKLIKLQFKGNPKNILVAVKNQPAKFVHPHPICSKPVLPCGTLSSWKPIRPPQFHWVRAENPLARGSVEDTS